MRFEELLHWNDGQFLQPHHFQYLQRRNSENLRRNLSFSLRHAWGLIDFEIDKEALAGFRIILRRFSAIMPSGFELSEPGNCILKALDLTETLAKFPPELTIYVGVPQWSEYEGNLAEDNESSLSKRYLTNKKRIRDENSGENEITIITRRNNARFLTDLDEARDMELLPILKLKVITRENSEPGLVISEKYVPPFMLLSSDCPLFNLITGLLVDVRRCRDKLLNALTSKKFKADDFSGADGHNLLMLRTLNLYEQRISSLLLSGMVAPFEVYHELGAFLAELRGLNPINGIRDVKKYDHEDLGIIFFEIISDIRSFILEKGGVGYIKRVFEPIDNGDYLFAALQTEDIVRGKEYYLAISTSADTDTIINALETGDTFKLISPQSKFMRTRGIKLNYLRYPPRYLPVLEKTLWFRFGLEESVKVWREICEEKGIILDYAQDLFPGLKASLFAALVE
ncbi:MAG: type VI secretion system baseplate subunit TssK [Spirochaetaceae bacterium]|jgi:type VI secretion system ImpJ/VasE family protein|nr:type VI secretion system baseplate subunit TssK [Spirochaetaceae bacterium]